MNTNKIQKHKILIVDDSEMNRMLLSEMLEDRFTIIEAENGVEAISILKECAPEICLILLDIIMPEMDGFEVLAYMNKYNWIDDIPVIVISAENASSSIENAYNLRATDFISRPFDSAIVNRRIDNTIMLYAKQRKLTNLVVDQIYEKEKSNNLMIAILSHIVEFRNGESGLHVIHIRTITALLLNALVQKTSRYSLSPDDITLISTASALHDIGKISISDKILNKPGRLTDEEFEIMKTHSSIGASMLSNLPLYKDENLVKVAYEICRWHHERYDGRGYPDGLKGEEIPISAQVVSLADVYDALTSERCYKKAFSHEKAMKMILNGECGTFNPLLLECLKDCGDIIQEETHIASLGQHSKQEITHASKKFLLHNNLTIPDMTLQYLELERSKKHFILSSSTELFFSYSVHPNILTLSPVASQFTGIGETTLEPLEHNEFHSFLGEKEWRALHEKIRSASLEQPHFWHRCICQKDGGQLPLEFYGQTFWTSTEPPEFTGLIGKIILL